MNNNTIKAMFESFVNSERCKTQAIVNNSSAMFESFVNSERCKTFLLSYSNFSGLRALLIQKDVKLSRTVKLSL